jgi:hypothetical protein
LQPDAISNLRALEPVKRLLAISSMLRILFAVVINLMIDCSLRPSLRGKI